MRLDEYRKFVTARRRVWGDRDGFRCCCPAHADEHPSLEVSQGRGAHAVVHCFAGCSFEKVLDADGLTWADWYGDDWTGGGGATPEGLALLGIEPLPVAMGPLPDKPTRRETRLAAAIADYFGRRARLGLVGPAPFTVTDAVWALGLPAGAKSSRPKANWALRGLIEAGTVRLEDTRRPLKGKRYGTRLFLPGATPPESKVVVVVAPESRGEAIDALVVQPVAELGEDARVDRAEAGRRVEELGVAAVNVAAHGAGAVGLGNSEGQETSPSVFIESSTVSDTKGNDSSGGSPSAPDEPPEWAEPWMDELQRLIDEEREPHA